MKQKTLLLILGILLAVVGTITIILWANYNYTLGLYAYSSDAFGFYSTKLSILEDWLLALGGILALLLVCIASTLTYLR